MVEKNKREIQRIDVNLKLPVRKKLWAVHFSIRFSLSIRDYQVQLRLRT